MNEEQIKRDIESNSQYQQLMEKAKMRDDDEARGVESKQHEIILTFIFAKQSGEEYTSPNTQIIVATLIDFVTDFYYDCDSKSLLAIAQSFTVESEYNKVLNEIEEGITDYIYNAIVYYYNSHL